jgi:hypothetical protein
MSFDEAPLSLAKLNLLLFGAGIALLLLGLFGDPVEMLKGVGFPASKLYGERGQADLAILRSLNLVVAAALVISSLLLWKDPEIVAKIAAATKGFASAAAGLPLFTTLFLGVLVLVKTVLQLSLYLIGYRAYAGDDFARALNADNWLQHVSSSFDVAAWLNLGWAQLPFPDYLFGVALALYRDAYVTPKILNLVLSSIAVVVVYLLGRELFGRAAGLFAATLCAFQPWIIWLGLSGMTSDLPSVIMMALFGVFLFRWLEDATSRPLLMAATCLFIAAGIRYENWFFSLIFSVVLLLRLISALRRGNLTLKSTTTIVAALIIANAFPVFHMAASYYFLGNLIPGMQATDSFKMTPGSPIPRINMAFLALSAFPLEIAMALGGIVLCLRSEKRGTTRLYLLMVALTFLSFATVFKGRLPIHGAGPERILLPYMVLLLPYAGYFLTRLFQAPRLHNPVYAVLAAALLLALGTFDIVRAFNYPARKFDRDAFAAGWTLRMLQGIENIPDNGRIAIEMGEEWIPFPILVLANKPERFVLLDDGELGKACRSGFATRACKETLLEGAFSMIILSSPEKIRAFEEIFSGRSWQVGKYQIFDLRRPAKENRAEAGKTVKAAAPQ